MGTPCLSPNKSSYGSSPAEVFVKCIGGRYQPQPARKVDGKQIVSGSSDKTVQLFTATPPFWLAIVTTLFTYTLSAILTRQFSKNSNATSMKPVSDQKAQDLKNRAVDTASSASNCAANTAQDLSAKAMDTASSTTDRTATTAQDIKDRNMDTAASTTDHATGMVQDLKNRTMERAHSANDGTGAKEHATGAQAAGEYGTAAPNAPGFDHNGLSKDRRTQLHPFESGSVDQHRNWPHPLFRLPSSASEVVNHVFGSWVFDFVGYRKLLLR
jgi:hypothetical protein